MAAPKNIQIPYGLFMVLVEVLENIDVSNKTDDFQALYGAVLAELQNKKMRLALRDDYSRLIVANKSGDEDKQLQARIEYFKNRNKVHFDE